MNADVADSDAEISMMVSMGYTAERAVEALSATGGNIDTALDYLINDEHDREHDQHTGEMKMSPPATRGKRDNIAFAGVNEVQQWNMASPPEEERPGAYSMQGWHRQYRQEDVEAPSTTVQPSSATDVPPPPSTPIAAEVDEDTPQVDISSVIRRILEENTVMAKEVISIDVNEANSTDDTMGSTDSTEIQVRQKRMMIAGVIVAVVVVAAAVVAAIFLRDSFSSDNSNASPSTGACIQIDCEVSSWQSWSPCSKQCDGFRNRTRNVVRNPDCNGDPCPRLNEEEDCNVNCCVDCEVTKWTTWTPCSVPCDGGARNHTRQVVFANDGCGQPCPHLLETQPCNTQEC